MNGGGASMNSGDLGRLEEELSQLSRKDLVARTIRAEGEARELQHSIHVQAGELRHLRENQQRLTDDNQVRDQNRERVIIGMIVTEVMYL